jgi:hypothetical protein
MSLPDDVVRWVKSHFGANVDSALTMLESAVDETGELVGPRLVRCAVVASRGDLKQLALLVAQLRTDWRDVIVSGEYELQGGELIQMRDLNYPIVDV